MRRAAPLLLVIAACGGAHYAAGVYDDGEVRYRLTPPAGPGWRAVEVERHNDLAYANDRLGAVIQVNGSCDPGLDIPLPALTNHLLFGFTERNIDAQELVPMDGREALRTQVRAKLDGVPRQLELVVLKKDGCVYDFALVARPGASFSEAQAVFHAMLDSFGTLR